MHSVQMNHKIAQKIAQKTVNLARNKMQQKHPTKNAYLGESSNDTSIDGCLQWFSPVMNVYLLLPVTACSYDILNLLIANLRELPPQQI